MKKILYIFGILTITFAAVWAVAQVVSGVTTTKTPTQVLVDSSGRVVTSGIEAKVDDAAFTPGTSSVEVVGGEVDDTGTPSIDSVDEGDAGAVRMSANRNMYMRIRDNAGNERGANVTASSELNVLESNSGTIVGDTTDIEAAVEIMDDWDSSDTAKVTIAAQSLTAVAVSATSAANTAANPIFVQQQAEQIDADGVGQCVAITDTDADFTLPTGSDFFRVCSYGNVSYINCAAATPAVDHVVGQFSIAIAEGQCHDFKITESTCAVIGVATAGFVCFYNYL